MLVRGIAVGVIGPFVMLLLHELAHIAMARLWTPVSLRIRSKIPFRIEMEFDEVPPRWYRRMIMIAPLLVGVVVAIGVLGSGLWTGLAQAEPHYLDEFLILNWIVFVIPSPTDVRGFINPKTSETTAAD